MTISKDASTEEKILDSAKDVFMKYGLYGARMQDIADQAGINKALLHYYFRTKEKLFDKVFENALERYFQQMEILNEPSLNLKQRLFAYSDNVIQFLSEYPQMSLFIIKEVSCDPEMFKQKIMAIKKPNGLKLLPLLEKEMEAGNIKKTNPIMFLVNFQSLCAYPFIAGPLFKHVLKANNKKWSEFSIDELKLKVHTFIENELGL